jgi:hypothetical protein
MEQNKSLKKIRFIKIKQHIIIYHGLETVFLFIKSSFGEEMIKLYSQEWIWEINKSHKYKEYLVTHI